MAELEKQAEDWSRLNRRLNMRLPVVPLLGRHERDEMEQQVREIDPCWNTYTGPPGNPGGVQHRRNEACRINKVLHTGQAARWRKGVGGEEELSAIGRRQQQR